MGLKPGLAQFCMYTSTRQPSCFSPDQGGCIKPVLDSSYPVVQASSVHLAGNHLCLSPSPWQLSTRNCMCLYTKNMGLIRTGHMAWFILPHWPTQSFIPEWDGNKALLVLIWEPGAASLPSSNRCYMPQGRARPDAHKYPGALSFPTSVGLNCGRIFLSLKSKRQCFKEKSKGAA